MAELSADWSPKEDDLAYWRFLRLTGRPRVAWLCLNEGTTAMWARPRDQFLRQAFLAKHAGHEHLFIGAILDRHLESQDKG